MPRFSRTSLKHLETCDERLQRLFHRVVRGWDCTILQGHRGKEAQNRAYEQGRSQLQWPDGKHNRLPSLAVDVAPYPIPEKWGNLQKLSDEHGAAYAAKVLAQFYAFAGYVLGIAEEMGIPIRFGGDWDMDRDFNDQKFDDLVHYEIWED